MSIQTGGGALRIDPDDLQITYRGKSIAVKIRNIMWPAVIGCRKQADGSWVSVADLTGDMFSTDAPGGGDAAEYWIGQHGGVMKFLSDVVVPLLNEWLAVEFTPSTTPVPALEQLQTALQGLRFVPQPDGTLKVTV